ncbi:MAG: putative acetyltransferase [Frankiales bacterium]|jgi:putative acetyltransferase|nr:putative acetyltransferase [Frankiales bacterium]
MLEVGPPPPLRRAVRIDKWLACHWDRLYRRPVLIREERPEDYESVAEVHQLAFGSHGSVVVPLVADLRASLKREPGLSLVADNGGRVVGHALYTRNLLDAPRRLVDVQVLSPVGVRPDRQRQGVGAALIRRGLEVLAQRGVPLVFLEGSPAYYSRFGFSAGEGHSFRRPSLRIPAAAFQVQLLPAYQQWMTGTLIYRHGFWDHDAVGLRESE